MERSPMNSCSFEQINSISELQTGPNLASPARPRSTVHRHSLIAARGPRELAVLLNEICFRVTGYTESREISWQKEVGKNLASEYDKHRFGTVSGNLGWVALNLRNDLFS
jgi:hypothetical protein